MAVPKLQRWIDLLAALLRRRYAVPFEELAQEVPGYQPGKQSKPALRRMFERDKDELRVFGVPIETVVSPEGEVEGYRLLARDFYLPYLSMVVQGRKTTPTRVDRYGYKTLAGLAFEPDELAAVAGAAARVRSLGVPDLAALAESACRKLAFDLPVDAARGAEVQVAGPVTGVRDEVFDVLAGALERRKRVTFRYRSMGRDEEAERTMEPLGLFFLSRHWYLAARAPGEKLVKNFRLSRMTGAVANPQEPGTPDYTHPAGFSLQKHAQSRQAWELGDGDAMLAEVSFDARSGPARAAARLGAPVKGHADRREFQVRRVDAFARWLLSLAGDATPVAPPELIAEYRAVARATAEIYAR
jgi:proteasome accessory factor B